MTPDPSWIHEGQDQSHLMNALGQSAWGVPSICEIIQGVSQQNGKLKQMIKSVGVVLSL